MLSLIHGNPENLEGKVTICAGLICDEPAKPRPVGIFASMDLHDIADFLYKKYDVEDGVFKKAFNRLEQLNRSESSTKINFYSIGISVPHEKISDNIITIKGDVLDIGHFDDEDKVNTELGNSLWNYAFNYISQHMPHAYVSDNDRAMYKLDYGENAFMLFLTSLEIPFDHYAKHNDSALKEVMWEDYIFPLRKAIVQQDNKIMNELINRFRHFMDTSQAASHFDFQPDMDNILFRALIKSEENDKIIDLYIDKFLALTHEYYEDAANIRDEIKKLSST
jgi:hypothetical protein